MATRFAGQPAQHRQRGSTHTIAITMHRYRSLPPRSEFYRRVLRNGGFAAFFILASLAVGIAGYHHFEHLNLVDSLLNASMILGGMGPVDPVRTTGGKLFASAYAMFSGIGFLVIAGVLFAPVIQRLFHRFHLEITEPAPEQTPPAQPPGGRQAAREPRHALPVDRGGAA